MSIDTEILTAMRQNGRALLIQALERQWPGCGAHTKRDQKTRADKVVWSELLPAKLQDEIRAFIDGWNAAMDAALRIVVNAVPVPIACGRTRLLSDPSRRAQALEGLNDLFSGDKS
jgi:hypothetical protein